MKIMKIIMTFFVTTSVMFASELAYADYSGVRLVLDARNSLSLPRNFRVSPDLHMAGGAQYSEMELQQILQRLRGKKLLVIDLRQESHGFLNGNAVSWYGPQDAANAGKTAREIEADQRWRLAALRAKKNVKVDSALRKSADGSIESAKPVEFAVHSVMSEAELAEKNHLRYQRIYVQDFHAPSVHETNRFIKLVRDLPASQWIYFHCHAGIGRTTTFMVMFDMMRNAKQDSFEKILARQEAIGGKDLSVLPASKASFKYAAADERMEFLHSFYDYAQDNEDGFKTAFK
jgi:protein-tyrosine phosphatase